MNPLPSLDTSSKKSDVLLVERSSEETIPAQNNTPAVLNSTQLSGALARETFTISSVASLEPQIVTVDSDSIENTIPHEFDRQHPIVPPSFKDLNLPPNPFIVLATMTVIRADEIYRPQSLEPSIPSPISTPPMNVSTIEVWETTHTTTDDATFYCEDEPRRVYWDVSSSKNFDSNEPRHLSIASSPFSTPPPPRRQKEAEHGDVFSQKSGVSQLTCEECGQFLPAKKTPDAQRKLKHYIFLFKL